MAAVARTRKTSSSPADSSLRRDDAEAWFGLLHAQSTLMREVDAALIGAHRLSLSAFELLFRLSQAEEGQLSITALAELVLISPSRVSRVVDDLAAEGLVERRRCASDARISYAAITDQGRGALPEIDATFAAAVRERFVDRLTRKDMDHLVAITRKLGVARPC
jgi:DNA-binding MarR family transcriptional regulator